MSDIRHVRFGGGREQRVISMARRRSSRRLRSLAPMSSDRLPRRLMRAPRCRRRQAVHDRGRPGDRSPTAGSTRGSNQERVPPGRPGARTRAARAPRRAVRIDFMAGQYGTAGRQPAADSLGRWAHPGHRRSSERQPLARNARDAPTRGRTLAYPTPRRRCDAERVAPRRVTAPAQTRVRRFHSPPTP